MDSNIIVALITGAVACVGYLITYFTGQKKNEIALEKHIEEIKCEQEKQMLQIKSILDKSLAVFDLRVEELSKNVEKHNQVVERTFHLEERMSVAEEKAKTANHRIDDLERITSNDNK